MEEDQPEKQTRSKTEKKAPQIFNTLRRSHIAEDPPSPVSELNEVSFTPHARNQAGEPRLGYCSLRSHCLLELAVVLYSAAPQRERPIDIEAGHGGIRR